jgi:starch phosphorylase
MSDGWQVELPETWLATAMPGSSNAGKAPMRSAFGGSVDSIGANPAETQRCVWKPQERMVAVAYDTPVVGWRAKRVNTLRLWTAQPIDPILLDAFNAGDHIGALRESNKAEALARVLYPADQTPAGQELQAPPGVFLLFRLAAGHPAPPSAEYGDCAPCRTRSRSSSMTPIRQCPWPN